MLAFRAPTSRRALTLLLGFALITPLTVCAQDEGAEPLADEAMAMDPAEKGKAFYALGLALSQQAASFELTEEELDHVVEGFRDGAMGREAKVDMNTYVPKLQAMAQERMAARAAAEKEAGQAFLAEQKAMDGAEVTESGLIYFALAEGEGKSPKAADKVTVHYHGTLADGSVFDSSVDRGEPATFPLNGVIKCWTEGVQKMKVGGKAKLVCPSEIAYGDQGRPPQIPPGAPLVFEVELIGIE